MRLWHEERGQSAVELVATLPFVLLLAAMLWQAVLAGQAVWLAGTAARSAARANAVGLSARNTAKGVLPARLERGLRVRADDEDGKVTVEVGVPTILARARLGTVDAHARFEPQSP